MSNACVYTCLHTHLHTCSSQQNAMRAGRACCRASEDQGTRGQCCTCREGVQRTHEAPMIACTCTRTHTCVHTGTSAHMPTFQRQLAHGWSKSWHIASDHELHVSRQQRGWSEGRCGCSRMQQHARAPWNRSLQQSDKGSAFFSGPTSGR